MALFGRRRKYEEFLQRIQEHAWEMAQFDLRRLLWMATVDDERLAEGDIVDYAENGDGSLVPGYMVLTPSDIVWAYARGGEEDEVEKLDVSGGFCISRMEFGPPDCVSASIFADNASTGSFMFPVQSELHRALWDHGEDLDAV